MTNIGIIGGGNIGEALLSGIIADGADPKTITVADPTQARLDELKDKYGLLTTTEGREAAESADLLFLCVKPDVVPVVIKDVAEALEAGSADTIIVSVAAGVTIGSMEKELPAGTPVVRVMPNTPMLVGRGAAGIAGGQHAEQSHLDQVQEIMAKVGTAVVVKEKDLDAVTAVSGSGPAYVFLVVESMIESAVQLGLPRPLAEKLAIANVDGAATMMRQGLEEGGDTPSVLRTKVTSPGGTTAAALRELEESGIRGAFFRAMEACKDRSEELGKPKA
ncbi:pyrroline-5-carboxylate reductase [Corynebacterium falsenii]|uniref:Pyrroline-5-carboxylate reductase n=1 Tax=Corynebacterium falsenii TaxID=108486 RepID=A0A418Q4R4_9CORY|nr:pyrroline-5-carboxylate reductase [Corynebacterium falsenii]AHI03973.1 pyrroline-5-carboxylate reductase [Corynebacterium falsenii DSM 44353]MDC7103251.1 pyrroline-5-carboxylate reductase [Corynebacterium falsenii]RIX33384.1 pyrroline-5-carboxylate reductase [Corynebacterium falsenii]UBI04749.1 pyrroline-5-carboxylate reductase [Corynebacterium falsenii]UBI07276.1 pyrroline-5-carboxylate reductase [Corynebacterium falsenii]